MFTVHPPSPFHLHTFPPSDEIELSPPLGHGDGHAGIPLYSSLCFTCFSLSLSYSLFPPTLSQSSWLSADKIFPLRSPRIRCATAIAPLAASTPHISPRPLPTHSSYTYPRHSWGREMLSSSDSCVCYISVCPPCRAVATSPTCVVFRASTSACASAAIKTPGT